MGPAQPDKDDPKRRTILRCDRDRAIINAAERIGWVVDPGKENAWPHNAHMEASIRVFKSVHRAVLYQSGLPGKVWHWSVAYVVVIFSVCQPAPLLPHGLDDDGNPATEEAKLKAQWSCWQAHHHGEPTMGPLQPFGRLCYYFG